MPPISFSESPYFISIDDPLSDGVINFNTNIDINKLFFNNPNKVFKGLTYAIDSIFVDKSKGVIAIKWDDKKVTKVKLKDGDAWDLETGICIAILKRVSVPHHKLQKIIENTVVYTDEKKKGKNEKSKKKK